MMTNEEKHEKMSIKKYIKKVIFSPLFISLLVVLLLMSWLFYRGYSEAKERYEQEIHELKEQVKYLSNPTAKYTIATKKVSLDLINSEIKDIGELATIEYLYTNAGKFENLNQLFGINVPFTTKSFIAKWDGVIKAGVEVNKIKVEINDSNKEIIIYMPKSAILSHEIKKESIETLDEKDGLFNTIKVDDVREFDKVSKEEMEERAIENGILNKASENAKNIIEKLINTDVVKEQGYVISFKTIE